MVLRNSALTPPPQNSGKLISSSFELEWLQGGQRFWGFTNVVPNRAARVYQIVLHFDQIASARSRRAADSSIDVSDTGVFGRFFDNIKDSLGRQRTF
ncbi:hypothetical protein [Pseudomonas sp. PSB11]|uniref:hypothetical protein n=1 Tax=Pseudomonas sp. PSB11 TaxID=2021969 RepID=UPI001660FE5A